MRGAGHAYDPTQPINVQSSVAAGIAGEALQHELCILHSANKLRRQRPELSHEVCVRVARLGGLWMKKALRQESGETKLMQA